MRRYDEELREQDEAVNAAQTSEILDLLRMYGQTLSHRVLAANSDLLTALETLNQPASAAKKKIKKSGAGKPKKKKTKGGNAGSAKPSVRVKKSTKAKPKKKR